MQTLIRHSTGLMEIKRTVTRKKKKPLIRVRSYSGCAVKNDLFLPFFVPLELSLVYS